MMLPIFIGTSLELAVYVGFNYTPSKVITIAMVQMGENGGRVAKRRCVP